LSEGRFAEIAGALLLGGASERMGSDKAALELAGEPAARRTARLLATLFEEVLLVGGQPPDGTPGRRVADPAGPRCALRGLVGALEAARAERVLVVATDLPGLTADLLLALVALP
jgi:molybdopterin-guanine dinucleotide biosynthesis protein A